MLKIKYIENILDSGKRKEKEIDFHRGKTIKEYAQEVGFPVEGVRAIVSGKEVESLDKTVKNEDEIIITPEIEGPFTAVFTWVADFFFSAEIAGTIWATIATVLDVAFYAYSIYSAVVAGQRGANYGMGEGLDEGSSTYGWDGIRTGQDVGIPVPVVYGEHRVGGNIINAWIQSDGRKNYLNVLLALCEGDIESITDLQINGNDAVNFDGITQYKRYGENTQTVVPHFEEAHNLYDVGVNLNSNSDTHTYTTNDNDVEGFLVRLQFPGGVYQAEKGIEEWSVSYKVEYKLSSDSIWTTAGTRTVTDKSRSRIREVFRQESLTAGQYDIKVTRTSAGSSDDPVKQGDLVWNQLDEIKNNDFAYPNTALLGIRALATDQLSGTMPNFTCVIKGKKISAPKVMNGTSQVAWENYYWDDTVEEFKLLSDNTSLTWDGSTYTDQWCANPVWCMKDFFTNSRYGLGEFIKTSVINDNEFTEMAKYCEEKVPDGQGGFEKRFRLDVVIDSQTKALDLLLQMVMNFRGAISYSAGKVRLLIDKPDTPVQLFNMGSIIKDSFRQSWQSIKKVPTVIEAQFLDKDENYEQETVAYIDEDAIAAGEPMRKSRVRFYATRKSQVLREARYAMKGAKYRNRSITFKTGIESITCQPGDVISIQHDVPQWGYGGRVVSAASSSVTLDQTVTIEDGKNYKVRVQLEDGSHEEKDVTNSPGYTSTLTVATAWTTVPSAYDKYTFGESGSIKKDFQVQSMERENKNEVKISALEYNVNVYDDSDIDLPDNNYSSLNLNVPSIDDLTLTERLVKLKDGTVEDAIDVWWDNPDVSNYVRKHEKCRVYISETDSLNKEDYRFAGEASGKKFSIIGDIVDGGTYYIKVVVVSKTGQEGKFADAPKDSITIVGKSEQPNNVGTFLVNQDRDRIRFGWTEISDVDVWGYEIRLGATWDSGEKVAFVQGTKFITTDFKTGVAQSYWIKALDTSGNYSANATEAVITVAEIPFRNIIKEYSEKPSWSGDLYNLTIDGNNNLTVPYNPTFGEMQSYTFQQLQSFTMGAIGTGTLSGTYTTAVKDIGYVASFKIITDIIVNITTGLAFNSDGTLKFSDSQTLRFTGEEAIDNFSLEIRTSDDNITWSSWKSYQVGEYNCRYYQLKLTLSRSNTGVDVLCSTFDHFADLPDVDEFGSDSVTNASSGKAVTFEKTFHEEPSVHIEITSGNGIYFKFTSKDTTGFTVKLYDASGVAQTGEFDFHGHSI